MENVPNCEQKHSYSNQLVRAMCYLVVPMVVFINDRRGVTDGPADGHRCLSAGTTARISEFKDFLS